MYKVGLAGAIRGLGPAAMFDLLPDTKLVAICDPNKEALVRCGKDFPEARQFTEYKDMLNYGLDIVLVGTPMPLHASQTIAALDAGCHVIQEVTLSDTIEGCKSILDSVKAHPKQKFMLAENCCYWGHILAWKEMWDQGMLGKFMYAESEYVHDIRPILRKSDGSPTWRASRPPIVYCTHSLGPLLKITGECCVSTSCMHTGSKLDPDLGNLDFMVSIFQTSSGGVIKVLRAQAVVRKPEFHYYTLYGTKGCLETSRPPIEPLQTNAYFEYIPHTKNMVEIPIRESVEDIPEAAMKGGHGTAEYLMVSDFVDTIREDKPSPIDIYKALEMTLPGLCAYESSKRGGAPVAIPDWR